MQNHNVSGTIKKSSGISSKTTDNTHNNNNRSKSSADGDAGSAGRARGADTGNSSGGWQRSELVTEAYDGLDGRDGLASPGTARPAQSHFDLGPVLPDRAQQGEAGPSYDRLEVNPLGLHLRSDPADVTRGRGVYTDRRIPAGTLIEEAPVLLITKGQWEEGKMDDCVLGEYGFCWSGGGQGIGLGLASLFNHSSSPNVNFIRRSASSTIRFITSRTVEPDEELCICYSADESKLWFTPSGRASPAPSSDSSQDEFPQLTSDDLFDADQMAERERRLSERAERKRQVALSDQAKNRPTRRTALREQVFQPTPMYPGASGAGISGSEGGMVDDFETRSNLRADSASPALSSTSSFPIYPTPAERPSNELPPPLHANGLLGKAGPVEIDQSMPLDWSEDAWEGKAQTDIPGWGVAVRVKGPGELEEEAEDAAMMDVWVVAVKAQRDTRLILEFVRDQLPLESATKHLKKVARRSDPSSVVPVSPGGTRGPEEQVTMVVLCAGNVMSRDELVSALGAYHPSLVGLAPFLKNVPASPARTQEQLALKSPVWPVAYAAGTIRPADSSDWSAARAAWVQAGLRRAVDIAMQAQKAGELPVGVFCVSPPESLWPASDNFIPPTQDLRASGHDTRVSAAHPLKHASFNCIRNVANLRTQPPFSSMQPKRNGADYLLTSLTLFVTHEPCPMCCMALLHSRVREVFYIYPCKTGGGLESAFGVHGRRDLNHRFEVWRYEGAEVEGWREMLKVDDSYAL